MSHPAGVRGLKPFLNIEHAVDGKSHPAGVRGLKHDQGDVLLRVDLVAPRRGAWIETVSSAMIWSCLSVAPRRGAWIETGTVFIKNHFVIVAPRRGAWIETTD